MKLHLLEERLAVCRLAPDAKWPEQALPGGFCSVTRTAGELSIVAPEHTAPEAARRELGWRAFEVAGPLDFSLTGVLSALTGPLAKAEIGVFAISTFDTDYLLVRENDVARAVAALVEAGHDLHP